MRAAIVLSAALIPAFAACHTTDRFLLLPAQTLHLQNNRQLAMRITSDYPVDIAGDGCTARATVSASLVCGPDALTVTDTRRSLLSEARANQITIITRR